jgi:hypothetical protein
MCRFVDGTFKVMRPPFKQLWTVHVHIRNGLKVKQIPVVFVLMTKMDRASYSAVLLEVIFYIFFICFSPFILIIIYACMGNLIT